MAKDEYYKNKFEDLKLNDQCSRIVLTWENNPMENVKMRLKISLFCCQKRRLDEGGGYRISTFLHQNSRYHSRSGQKWAHQKSVSFALKMFEYKL